MAKTKQAKKRGKYFLKNGGNTYTIIKLMNK